MICIPSFATSLLLKISLASFRSGAVSLYLVLMWKRKSLLHPAALATVAASAAVEW